MSLGLNRPAGESVVVDGLKAKRAVARIVIREVLLAERNPRIVGHAGSDDLVPPAHDFGAPGRAWLR